MQIGSGSGNFRQSRVGLRRIELCEQKKDLLNFLLRALFYADRSAD